MRVSTARRQVEYLRTQLLHSENSGDQKTDICQWKTIR